MPLELEEEWSKQKAAKQEAGRQPPPRKSRKGLLIALVGIVVAGAMVAVVIYAGDEPKPAASTERVFIEIRSMPRGDIRIDGKKVGTTPMALQFPKSTKQITVEVTLEETFFSAGSKRRIDKTYKPKRIVTLDHDQTLDFTRKHTKAEPDDPAAPQPELPEPK